ncbi:hypothetical protein [Sphingorhabdus wooponensis]|jgi:hypothetical protein|uniref:Uncharacterized protein n=1 Tax=Sphingorhabdus wooponensis TaxID=940136 RepID=A0A3R8R7H1_9SPHN|nr:hypothetical protein [Sphingorhabdus wooponensis]RRQ51670.1 hypothetical protein D7D48_01870 [Sphingorhabdus wooponensis]
MNTERLMAKAESLGAARVQQVSDRLIAADLPQGVRAERSEDGVTLVAKNLRRRMLDDAILRSFGR